MISHLKFSYLEKTHSSFVIIYVLTNNNTDGLHIPKKLENVGKSIWKSRVSRKILVKGKLRHLKVLLKIYIKN